MIGRPPSPKLTPEVAARLGGEPDTVIAAAVGVCPLTVRNWRRARGIPAAPPALARCTRTGRGRFPTRAIRCARSPGAHSPQRRRHG